MLAGAPPISQFLEFAHHDFGHHGWGGGWWVVMVVGMVLVAAAVAFALVWAAREARGGDRTERGESPHEILDRRLASGEIGVEEYEAAVAALQKRAVDAGGT